MSRKPKTFLLGRDSKTGQFVAVKEAIKNPHTSRIEKIPKPGFGDRPRPPRKM